MKIAIDARLYSQSGVGRYIRNLIAELKKADQNNEYFILHLGEDYRLLPYHGNFHKVEADFKWYGFAEQYKLPAILNALKPDLVHFPHFNIPVFYRGNFVVTVHDLIHRHFSMERATTRGPLVYKIKQFGYGQVFRHAVLKSRKILVPSFFVKEQLKSELNAQDEKITVTYEAAEEAITTLAGKRSKPLINSPYIFYAGNAHPHKNIEGLIKAFMKIKARNKNLKLVLAGADHYFWQRIKKEHQGDDIIYTGFVSDEELVGFYQNAKVFVMPSFEEGFGIPLLEAFACSCPVVSSKAGSLPEVGGDAVLYFDPEDSNDMAEKIGSVLADEKLRQNLIKKGLKRLQLFSWRTLARKTLEVYKQCVLQ